jgi:hypothetical protein
MYLYLKCCLAVWMVATALIQEPANKSQESSDAMELSRLETVWNGAHMRSDAEALDRLWADDLVVTVTNMPVMTKPEAIGFLRSGRMKFQRYQTSDIRIRVYGDAAVVTGGSKEHAISTVEMLRTIGDLQRCTFGVQADGRLSRGMLQQVHPSSMALLSSGRLAGRYRPSLVWQSRAIKACPADRRKPHPPMSL